MAAKVPRPISGHAAGISRPLSPHLQIYRPQLTSVLSFAHRMTGVVLGAYAIGLVTWLTAAAAGPQSFARARAHLQSPIGKALLLVCTFCFFLHLCGGIRHLMWDSSRGLELESIYLSGWIVVAMSMLLTALTWIISIMLGGQAS